MKAKVQSELGERLKAFNEKYNTEINQDYFINFLKSVEALDDSDKEHREFHNLYVQVYCKLSKQIYQKIVTEGSKISVEQDPEHQDMAMPVMKKEDELYIDAANKIRAFELLLSSSVDYTLDKCERKSKLELDPEEEILGNTTPDVMYTFLSEGISRNNPMEAFKSSLTDEEFGNEDLKAQRGYNILHDIEKIQAKGNNSHQYINISERQNEIYKSCSVAVGELEKQAAAVYCALREEHRSHGILWRMFRGGESRKRLNDYKEEYCRIMNVKKGDATNRMLRLSTKCDTLDVMNSKAIIASMKETSFFEGIKKNGMSVENKHKYEVDKANFFKGLEDPNKKKELDLDEIDNDEFIVERDENELEPFDSKQEKIEVTNKDNDLEDIEDISNELK